MMVLAQEMGLSLSGRSVERRTAARVTLLLFFAAALLGGARLSFAQSVPVPEREALVRLGVERGRRAEDVEALIRRADEAAGKGLPAVPVTNKIREGLAKGHDTKRIDLVIQQIVLQLVEAEQLLKDVQPSLTGPERDASLILLAESLGGGVTQLEVREIVRLASGATVSSDRLSGAAKGYSFIKEARLPSADGTAVIAEAVRQGFRSHELLDLGRAIKLRQEDYRAGRASLRDLREAIARGDRPEQLFRDSRPETATRPAATSRPEPPLERPERPTRPDPTQRPQQPERPTRPDRPGADRIR
jgi:hypothetical protein